MWLGENADHYYVLSRFLLSRMLTVTKVRRLSDSAWFFMIDGRGWRCSFNSDDNQNDNQNVYPIVMKAELFFLGWGWGVHEVTVSVCCWLFRLKCCNFELPFWIVDMSFCCHWFQFKISILSAQLWKTNLWQYLNLSRIMFWVNKKLYSLFLG